MDLTQVYLMCGDVEREIAFYRALGFPIVEEDSGSATFEAGSTRLTVESDFDESTLDAFGLRPPGESRGDGAIVGVEVDDVDAFAADATTVVAEHGGERLAGPRDVDWGRRLLLVRDPEGYVLEFFHPT